MYVDLQNLNEQLRELQPPSARDRLIFEAVVVKGRGQCEVAAEQRISQPRVSQIVAEVGAWLDRALPRVRQNESTSGEMAVGMYVVEAQIDFLLQQTMRNLRESKKDKVTEKAGTRGVVNWTETKTEGRQIAKVGLINMALRLSLAKAKLAGVDVTGRTQREAALAEERQRREAMGQETGDSGQETESRRQKAEKPAERQVKRSLIKKSGKDAVAAEIVQPQVQAGQEDKASFGTEEYIKNEVCKQLIKELRGDPGCAGWTDEQFQEYAQRVWNARPREGGEAMAFELASSPAADPQVSPLSKQERDSLPGGETIKFSDFPQGGSRQRERPRGRDKLHSPQERRREFLAPLAIG
jgi:hypothetical protein